jgi:hypothetical protein
LLRSGDDGVLNADLSTEAVDRKGDARAGTCRNVELDSGRGRGVAGATSTFAGIAGAVGGAIGDTMTSALGSVSAALGSGCPSIILGDAGAVAGSETGDGGTSTIATGIGEGTTITGSGSGVWPVEMTGAVTGAAGAGGAGGGGLEEIATRTSPLYLELI